MQNVRVFKLKCLQNLVSREYTKLWRSVTPFETEELGLLFKNADKARGAVPPLVL